MCKHKCVSLCAIAAELERLLALDEMQRLVLVQRRHVEEELLQIKCPGCGHAFAEFDGCFAIKCGR